MTKYTITNYDNSGDGQTLFAEEHLSTLSEAESKKIRELAKLTNKQEIKTNIDQLVLTNFQKQVGRYLLDVKALNNQSKTNWNPESDSIYQAVLTIMKYYDNSSPTYDQMIARYLAPEQQNQYLQDRKEIYIQSDVLNGQTSQAPSSTPTAPSATGVQTTNQPCTGPDCTPSSNTPQTSIEELSFNSLYGTVETIANSTQLTNFLKNNTDKNIIVYTSKKECNNCKTIAGQFPPAQVSDNNTVYIHVNITDLEERGKDNNPYIDGISKLNNDIKQMPIIFALNYGNNTKKRSIPQDKIYSVTGTDQYNNKYKFGNSPEQKILLTDMITKLTQATNASQT